MLWLELLQAWLAGTLQIQSISHLSCQGQSLWHKTNWPGLVCHPPTRPFWRQMTKKKIIYSTDIIVLLVTFQLWKGWKGLQTRGLHEGMNFCQDTGDIPVLYNSLVLSVVWRRKTHTPVSQTVPCRIASAPFIHRAAW